MGVDSKVKIRPATPADAAAAVPLVYSSGPDAFNFVFEQSGCANALVFLHRAFVDGDGEFGYRNHLVATVNGLVVGVGAGWRSDRNISFMLSATRQIIACYGIHSISVIIRGLRAEAVIQPPVKDRLYIAHLGVAVSHQSQGIGVALIEALIETQAFGCRFAALDVAMENTRGLALYQRLGFELVKERISTLRNAHGFVPSMRYMERKL